MGCERIVVPSGDPPAALVARAVTALAADRPTVVPTETDYGLVAVPGRQASIDALDRFEGRAERAPFPHQLASIDGLPAIAAPLPERLLRLLHRYWPGPLTAIVPAVPETGDALVGVRVPGHPFTRAVIDAVGTGSVFLARLHDPEGTPLVDADAVVEGFGSALELVFDAGPAPLANAATTVRWAGPGRPLEIVHEGALAAGDVLAAAADLTLFVCTGNTCRSPLAAGLARQFAAERLGVAVDDVLARGERFASAGVSAWPGSPASAGSLAAAAEVGVDLSSHASQPATDELLRSAQRILCLSESHLHAVAAIAPDVATRAELLDPTGGIPDPFGGDLETYRLTRDRIADALRRRSSNR